MAKSSRKRKKAPAKQPKNVSSKRSAEETKPTSFPTRYVIYGIAVLALAGACYGFFAALQEEGAFERTCADHDGETLSLVSLKVSPFSSAGCLSEQLL